MAPEIHELRVDASSSSVPVVTEFMAGCCRVFGVDDDASFAIQLAVDEATTNIVQHAYKGKQGPLRLRCWVDQHDVFIELRDQGKRFLPEEVQPPTLTGPLSARRIGGLGLHFMRQLMDEVQFSIDDTGNRVLMIKRDVAP